jgi:hypothetical protein
LLIISHQPPSKGTKLQNGLQPFRLIISHEHALRVTVPVEAKPSALKGACWIAKVRSSASPGTRSVCTYGCSKRTLRSRSSQTAASRVTQERCAELQPQEQLGTIAVKSQRVERNQDCAACLRGCICCSSHFLSHLSGLQRIASRSATADACVHATNVRKDHHHARWSQVRAMQLDSSGVTCAHASMPRIAGRNWCFCQ